MAKKQSQVLSPLTLPVYVVDDTGKVIGEEQDPLRTADLRYKVNVLDVGDRDKGSIAGLAQNSPVVWRDGEFVHVARIWIRIVNEDGDVEQDVSEDHPVLVAELTEKQAQLCGLADNNGRRLREFLLVAYEWLKFGADCRSFQGSLPVLASKIASGSFDWEDADIGSDITFIKPLKKKDLPQAFASVALHGVSRRRDDNLFAQVQPGREKVNPVWYALYKVVEQGITTWGQLDSGLLGKKEIGILKARMKNHLRYIADTKFLLWAGFLARRGQFDAGKEISALSNGFGWYPNPRWSVKKVREVHKLRAEQLFEIVRESNDRLFLAWQTRCGDLAGPDQPNIKAAAQKAYASGDITLRVLKSIDKESSVPKTQEQVDSEIADVYKESKFPENIKALVDPHYTPEVKELVYYG